MSDTCELKADYIRYSESQSIIKDMVEDNESIKD